MLEPNKDTIIVIDCGSQYTHLIANRIRRFHVFSEIVTPDISIEQLRNAKGIIISGGPASVYDEGSPTVDPEIFHLDIPVLGVCYGHHLMAYLLHGEVKPGKKREYGKTYIQKIGDTEGTIFNELKQEEDVWMSHGDEVIHVPNGFEVLYKSSHCSTTVMANKAKKLFGVQFHPEVKHTKCGNIILEQFIHLCGVKREWTMEWYMEEEMKRIQKEVGNRNVFLLASGGIDSTVAFVILSRTLGKERVYGLFVDTGFMRKNEIEQVAQSMKALGFDNLFVADAKDDFFMALQDVYDPERKRNIIGAKFLEVKDHWAEKLHLDSEKWILGQGTIYPDTIESGGTKHADKIKTHHNRIDQIEKLIHEGRLVEPLKELYKDEVRELGMKLGIPKELVWRHPFPGPGLAIRILCGEKENTALKAGDLEKEIEKERKYECMMLPVKSVGVQGDNRTYAHPLSLFLEGDEIEWEKLEEVSTEITNSYREINRVVLCLSHENKPEKLSFISGYLSKERTAVLQDIDALVNDFFRKHGVMENIWQCPIILLPISLDGIHESIMLRPVESSEAMTANFSKIDPKLLHDLIDQILATGKISMVFYDITNKPPATIEWE